MLLSKLGTVLAVSTRQMTLGSARELLDRAVGRSVLCAPSDLVGQPSPPRRITIKLTTGPSAAPPMPEPPTGTGRAVVAGAVVIVRGWVLQHPHTSARGWLRGFRAYRGPLSG
jgi:hypothetical protein